MRGWALGLLDSKGPDPRFEHGSNGFVSPGSRRASHDPPPWHER